MPPDMTDRRAKRVISSLLNRSHETRFGGSWKLIWQDDWIREGQPDLIRRGEKKPPFF
jgi:hypothetical protein